MELYQLEYFRVLCRCGSFTNAAFELSVTQPAVSMAIKKLEDEYGELIDRKSKTFALTQMGKVLLKWSISIHKEVANMGKELNADLQTKREVIKIALPLPLCPELTTGLATTFINQHADIAVQILQKGHVAIVDDLINRTVDIGVLCEDMLHPMLESKDYGNVEFYAIFSPEHRFNQFDMITPDLLEDETIIYSQTINSITSSSERYFSLHNIQPNCEYYNILPEDARKLAQRSSAIAFGPKHVGGKHSAPLSPPLYCKLVVAWVKGNLTMHEEELINFIVGLGQSNK